jgi:hypothetical protein
MRVNGIDDNEFKLISNEVEFYKIVNDYIKVFELTPDEIIVSNNKFILQHFIVDEINYELDADLCSFILYSISPYDYILK